MDLNEDLQLKTNNKISEKEKFNNSNDKIEFLKKKFSSIYFNYEEKCKKIEEINLDGFQEEIRIVPSYIILPSSKPVRIWRLLIYILACYSIFFIPIDVGFGKVCMFHENVMPFFHTLDVIVIIFFLVDICLNFVIASYNNKGRLVTTFKEIAETYLKGHFISDLLCSIPYKDLLTLNGGCGETVDASKKIILFLGLSRFFKIATISTEIEKSNTKHINIFRLIKLLLFFYYVCHFTGCCIVGLSDQIIIIKPLLDGTNEKTAENFFKIYSYSINVGIVLILGGDPGLFKPSEQICIVMIVVASIAVTAHIFGYIGLILEKINSSSVNKSKNLREKLDLINEYLIYENMNESLRTDVNNFYKFMYIRQRMLFEQNKMYSDLTPNLICSIKLEVWKYSYFINDKLFCLDVISPMFFFKALEVMEGRIFKKGEIIYEEFENSMDVYLVCTNSICEIYCSGLLMKINHEGEFFGETAVFTSSKKRSNTAISKTDGDFLILPGREFYNLLLDYETEKNYFMYLATKELKIYNEILTPKQFINFVTKNNEVYQSIIHKNLHIRPKTQEKYMFYKRDLGDCEQTKKISFDKKYEKVIEENLFSEEDESID